MIHRKKRKREIGMVGDGLSPSPTIPISLFLFFLYHAQRYVSINVPVRQDHVIGCVGAGVGGTGVGAGLGVGVGAGLGVGVGRTGVGVGRIGVGVGFGFGVGVGARGGNVGTGVKLLDTTVGT